MPTPVEPTFVCFFQVVAGNQLFHGMLQDASKQGGVLKLTVRVES